MSELLHLMSNEQILLAGLVIAGLLFPHVKG